MISLMWNEVIEIGRLRREWKPIVIDGVKDMYDISNYGEIYSKKTGKILRWIKKHNGYYRVNLQLVGGGEKEFSIHRLVALHFIPIPDGYSAEELHVNHKEGDKSKNRSTDLEWTTPSQNVLHAFRSGIRIPGVGVNSTNCKYSEEVVRDICQALQDGYRGKQLLSHLHLDESYYNLVKRIKKRRHWRCISDSYKF